MNNQYALITAAFNEEKFIEQTLNSIISQTIQPVAWIIVSDGSTDNTDQIVRRYAERWDFISLFRITEEHPRNFAAQVYAINSGLRELQRRNLAVEFIGNIDADVSMEADYFERLINKFRANPRLGLAGGMVHDRCADGSFKNRPTNARQSVAHATQFFRRECFESVGGAYVPLPFGGPDTFAEVTARMKGWSVESFSELHVLHYRPTGSAGGILRSSFRQGKMDYSLGYGLCFEFAKVFKRMGAKPYILAATTRLAGFLHSSIRREKRAVPEEFIGFLRNEQRNRLKKLLSRREPTLSCTS